MLYFWRRDLWIKNRTKSRKSATPTPRNAQRGMRINALTQPGTRAIARAVVTTTGKTQNKMRVIKILINKQEVEVPDGAFFSEFVFAPFFPVMLDDGQVLAPGQRYEIRYRVAYVENEASGEWYHYAVRVGAEGLFQDLIRITDEQVADRERQAVEKEREVLKRAHVRATLESVNQSIKQIKKLPWYRRLFNKF